MLPAGPDPFLLTAWLRNFRTWSSKVDRLYVIVCGQTDRKLKAYIRAEVKAAGATLVGFAPRQDHGIALGQVMAHVTEDLVMLCEDDAFVREPGKIDECFERIERDEVDVVGCPRSSGTDEVITLANARFGHVLAPVTSEMGPLFWPCFLFAKRADLEAIGNYSVWAGDALLGQTFGSEQVMDTFGYASLMLRENGARVRIEPNYRVDRAKINRWNSPPWFHVGSLSTGYGTYICGPRAHNDIWAQLRESDLEDWCKRVAFWEYLGENGDDLGETRGKYLASVAELARETNMNRVVINDWREKLAGLMN